MIINSLVHSLRRANLPIAFIIWCLALLLLGGSARGDSPSLIGLLPFTTFAVVLHLVYWRSPQAERVKQVLVVIGLLMVLCLVQLVPLPPIWASGPRAGSIAAISNLANIGEAWRPLSVSPTRGWGAFAGLFVPLAAALFYARVEAGRPALVATLLISGALLSALVSLAQAIWPDSDALYLYHFTNPHEPVGLFANRNHNAVFLAIAMLWLAYAYVYAARHYREPRHLRFATMAAAVVIFLAILINSSRAGLITTMVAFGLSGWMVLKDRIGQRAGHSARKLAPPTMRDRAMPTLALGTVMALSVVFFVASRLPALDRVLRTDSIDDLRFKVLPLLLDLAWQYLPWGTGFGTFDLVYRSFEPDRLLMTTYLNNAHNDWLQLVIAGGLPAAALVAVAVALILRRVVALYRMEGEGGGMSIAAGGSILILAMASAVDYPMRTPLMMAVVTLIACLLADRSLHETHLD